MAPGSDSENLGGWKYSSVLAAKLGLQEKVESKNKLESYLFSVRNTMLNDEKMKTNFWVQQTSL
mgnify:CR=1 FL=1